MESAVEVAEILVADFCQSIIALERVGGRKLLVQPQHFEPLPYFSYIMALGKAIVELQVKTQLLVVEIGKIFMKDLRQGRSSSQMEFLDIRKRVILHTLPLMISALTAPETMQKNP